MLLKSPSYIIIDSLLLNLYALDSGHMLTIIPINTFLLQILNFKLSYSFSAAETRSMNSVVVDETDPRYLGLINLFCDNVHPALIIDRNIDKRLASNWSGYTRLVTMRTEERHSLTLIDCWSFHYTIEFIMQ